MGSRGRRGSPPVGLERAPMATLEHPGTIDAEPNWDADWLEENYPDIGKRLANREITPSTADALLKEAEEAESDRDHFSDVLESLQLDASLLGDLDLSKIYENASDQQLVAWADDLATINGTLTPALLFTALWIQRSTSFAPSAVAGDGGPPRNAPASQRIWRDYRRYPRRLRGRFDPCPAGSTISGHDYRRYPRVHHAARRDRSVPGRGP